MAFLADRSRKLQSSHGPPPSNRLTFVPLSSMPFFLCDSQSKPVVPFCVARRARLYCKGANFAMFNQFGPCHRADLNSLGVEIERFHRRRTTIMLEDFLHLLPRYRRCHSSLENHDRCIVG